MLAMDICFAVIPESPEAAEMGVKKVKVTYTDVEPSILTTRDGVEKESFFPKFGDDIDHGDVEGKIIDLIARKF